MSRSTQSLFSCYCSILAINVFEVIVSTFIGYLFIVFSKNFEKTFPCTTAKVLSVLVTTAYDSSKLILLQPQATSTLLFSDLRRQNEELNSQFTMNYRLIGTLNFKFAGVMTCGCLRNSRFHS